MNTTLIEALQSIGNNVCVGAAKKLASARNTHAGFNLHLRSAGLNTSDAEKLAEALKLLPADSDSPLVSFSVSYNRAMGDAGAIALAEALPLTLREIGFVGCALNDESGNALLESARQMSSLKMICVEDNNFSEKTKSRFRDLRHNNAGLWVVV